MIIPENQKIVGIEILTKELRAKRKKVFKDFLKFREHYFKEYHDSPDSEFHMEMANLFMDTIYKRGSKIAAAAPRESAKTTLLQEFIIYCVCYKLENYIVIISSTRDQAMGLLRDIKYELDNNERLRNDFPEACDRQVKPRPSPWKEFEIITPNQVKITALGSDQEIRGRRNKQDRPSLIILDDLETSEPIQNPSNINKLEDWVTKSVLKAGSNITNIIYVGTIHHYDSLLAKFTGNHEYPGWIKRVYRSIISDPENMALWEQWRRIFNRKELYEGIDGKDAAIRFFEANKEQMLKGTKVLWPQRKSYHDLMIQREQEGSFSFDSEMQNEPINPRDCHFPPEENHYWGDIYKTENELMDYLRSHDTSFFGACDPSTGKEGMRGDRSAIVTVIMDHTDRRIYVLDADIEKRLPDKLYADILSLHARYQYSAFVFETNQAQETMAMELQNRAMASGLMFNIVGVKAWQDKIAKLQGLQPYIKHGDILFSRRHYGLLEELRRFPRGRYDDGIDALQLVVDFCLQSGAGRGGYPEVIKSNSVQSHVLSGIQEVKGHFMQVHNNWHNGADPNEPPLISSNKGPIIQF